MTATEDGGPAPSAGPGEQRWDWLLRVAARVLGTPMAAVSLVDGTRATMRDAVGVPPVVLPLDQAICAVTVGADRPLIVPDAAADPQFRDYRVVAGPPFIRFYVGLPIPGADRRPIGALACLDTMPRAAPPQADIDLLADLAAQVGEGLRREAETAALIGRHARLEREMRAVVDAIPLAMMTIDRRGHVTAWNPAAERLFGWTAAEAIGRFGPHVPPDQIEASRAIQLPIATGERAVGIEAERWRKDGVRLPVAISTAPVLDEAGRPDGAVVMVEDISARRRAAEEAARRAARMEREAALLTGIATSRHLARGDARAAFRRILAAAVDRLPGCDAAIWRVAPEGGLRLAALDGTPAEDAAARGEAIGPLPSEPRLAAGRTLAVPDLAAGPDWLPPGFAAAGYGALLVTPVRVAGRLEGLLAALVPGGPCEWTAEDGGFLASLGDLAALALEAERLAAAMRSLEDAKARAEAASVSKSRFLARMSHELRTPLNAIIGFGDLLRDPGLGPQQRQDYADHVVAAGRQLLASLTAVLEHARIEAGTLVLERDRADPAALIAVAVAGVGPQAAGRGIAVARTDAPMPQLLGDAARLQAAIDSLLSNAVKFSPADGQVTIGGGFDPGSGYAIWVRDAGPGMTREQVAQALEPFRQVAEGLDRPATGAGLGLPLARAFVEAHGGRLVLDSAPGRGTLAVLTLPPELAVTATVDQSRTLSAS